jgi:hypothetical protein
MNLPMADQPKAPIVPGYPRPLTSIHQIEITSRCNLRCVYCPSRHLDKPISEGGSGRAKVDITAEHYARALEWAIHFDTLGTQGELALTGIGEALMHPLFVQFVRDARQALPTNPITFSTNGLLLNDALCEQLAPYSPRIYVSTHRPEKAGPAINAARRWGLLADTNTSFATEAFDWAGQVDWEVSIPPASVACEYLRSGWGVVLSDGRITTCCLDATGNGQIGHIDDEPGTVSTRPWSLCEPCHMVVTPPNQIGAAA